MLSKGTTHGRHALAGFITAQSTPIPISYGGLGMPIPFGGQLWYKAGGTYGQLHRLPGERLPGGCSL